MRRGLVVGMVVAAMAGVGLGSPARACSWVSPVYADFIVPAVGEREVALDARVGGWHHRSGVRWGDEPPELLLDGVPVPLEEVEILEEGESGWSLTLYQPIELLLPETEYELVVESEPRPFTTGNHLNERPEPPTPGRAELLNRAAGLGVCGPYPAVREAEIDLFWEADGLLLLTDDLEEEGLLVPLAVGESWQRRVRIEEVGPREGPSRYRVGGFTEDGGFTGWGEPFEIQWPAAGCRGSAVVQQGLLFGLLLLLPRRRR